jgi:hypothetical protein
MVFTTLQAILALLAGIEKTAAPAHAPTGPSK